METDKELQKTQSTETTQASDYEHQHEGKPSDSPEDLKHLESELPHVDILREDSETQWVDFEIQWVFHPSCNKNIREDLRDAVRETSVIRETYFTTLRILECNPTVEQLQALRMGHVLGVHLDRGLPIFLHHLVLKQGDVTRRRTVVYVGPSDFVIAEANRINPVEQGNRN